MSRRGKAEEWIWVFQQQLRAMLTQPPRLTGTTLRVWLYILSQVGYAEWAALRQVGIAQELHISAAQVSKAVRLLVARGLVRRRLSAVHGTQYSHNSHYVYKGAGEGLGSRRARDARQTGG